MQTNSLSMQRSAEGNRLLEFFSKIYIALNVLVYAGFTIGFFLVPIRLASMIGIEIKSSAALADFRAMYGGLCLGVGVVLLFGLFKEEWRRASILLAITTASGLFLGRIYTLFLDGPGNEYIYLSMATEVGAVAIGTWILQRTSK
ncbi:DUF4345 domain-containing protein [Leptospira sp. FAT2]|uniref:DUF4345 domain-containing protein n=1 Tax=Leptospira sanjuanensis TaxID=2879643 RepID=UPI001EE92EC6|nr:DUF4345 domain-containing protein [Leptospira sanjuanensis]MCG6167237.1 DUF4345 domain-containing protein [Leptospira sanjuanensis]MCG6192662.1 DUF4345 domain-containing protein [Leptospira sanjuanensis]